MSSGASASFDPRIEDFTEDSYRGIVQVARRRWSFEPFGTDCDKPHVLWRHDVDFSVHRGHRLARIEADEQVLATYFFNIHSPFYNLMEAEVLRHARGILGLGHRLGLHFDTQAGDPIGSADELARRIEFEASLLQEVLQAPVEAFSFHNPSIGNDFAFEAPMVAGLVNAYGRPLRERYAYVSDSNGIWRHRSLLEVVAAGVDDRLHVLTHPEWWQAQPMRPRDRVIRCVEGRAAASLAAYDRVLADAGRPNVG
jgi:hypothetical protein